MIRRPPRPPLFPYPPLFRSRPRGPATLNPTNSARAPAAERPTRMTSLPRRRFEGGHWWDRESTSGDAAAGERSEEHTSELQSQSNLVCRLLLGKKKHTKSAR